MVLGWEQRHTAWGLPDVSETSFSGVIAFVRVLIIALSCDLISTAYIKGTRPE